MLRPSQLDEYSEFEHIPCRVFARAQDASVAAAAEIANLIRQRQSQSRSCVLGLATGSSPVGIYEELVRLHREEGLSFRNVVTFNLDEYYPMQPDELQSYVRFMREHLFDLIDIDPVNVHIPDGTLAIAQVPDFCRRYEEQIAGAGGIDIQLLGIGRTGHVGFNEPGSSRTSRTRLITLDHITRRDAASDFFGEEHVPRQALTMGVGTILDARRLLLLAFGEHKASIVAKAVEGPVTPSIAATFLQEHSHAQILMDTAAAAALIRSRAPWQLGPVQWNDPRIRKAVTWLAIQQSKPILKLTDEDYNEQGLQDLLAERGPAYNINLQVFRQLQATITGWPGGKPHIRQTTRRPAAVERRDFSQAHTRVFAASG